MDANEYRLAKFWSENKNTLKGRYHVNEFIEWAKEWEKACNKIKEIGEQQREGK